MITTKSYTLTTYIFSCLWAGLFIMAAFFPNAVLAQAPAKKKEDTKKVVQLSGLVVSTEAAIGMPGVAIFIPKAGRGVVTNNLGYFSIATLAGDSAVISGLGFKKQYYIVPNDGRQSISVIIHLEDDPIAYPSIEVMPFPTEELFKQAFLDLKLPEEDINQMRRNLNENTLARMRFEMPMDGNLNHNYFLQQQIMRIESRNMNPTTTQLLNPFAWGRFIESVRRGDLKKRPYMKD